MTLILLGLNAIPKPNDEALEREKKLEHELKAMIKGEEVFVICEKPKTFFIDQKCLNLGIFRAVYSGRIFCDFCLLISN